MQARYAGLCAHSIPTLIAAFVIFCQVCLLCPNAFGDGKIFPPTAYPSEVKIPDQTALIVWSENIERLVIETRFEGAGTNFAWIIPCPAEPVIEPATFGVFTTLRYLFQPEIRHNIAPIWAAALLGGGLCWLFLTVRKQNCGWSADLAGCLAVGVGFGFLLGVTMGCIAFGVALYVVQRVRGRGEPMYLVLIVCAILFVLSSMLLPALGVAGITSVTGVDVLSRKRVGVYDTTTVSADDPSALPRWLQDNGFVLTPGSLPVLEQYAREGWVFVAASINREVVTDSSAVPHPLSFTFPAKQPIYPLRLTAVGNDELSLDLYVFGPEQAKIEGFEVMECHRAHLADKKQRQTSPDLVLYRHPLLKEWIPKPMVCTKLAARLTTSDMQNDVTISWTPFKERRTILYSRKGAFLAGLNLGVPVAVCVLLVTAIVTRVRKPSSATTGRLAIGGVCLGGLVSLVAFTALPKVEVRLQRMARFRSVLTLRNLPYEIEAHLSPQGPRSLDTIRSAFSKIDETELNDHC